MASVLLASCAQEKSSSKVEWVEIPEEVSDTSWYYDTSDFVPITDPFFDEAYGKYKPTVESITGEKLGRKLLCTPDSIKLYEVRPEMPEDRDSKDYKSLCGFTAINKCVELHRDHVKEMVDELFIPKNYSYDFLSPSSADFGFTFSKGTNSLEIVFDLATPCVRFSMQNPEHDDRRIASWKLMAEACKIASSFLYDRYELQRKIEIFKSNKQVENTP